MKALILALMVFMWINPAWAVKHTSRPQAVGPETTLRVATHYLDSVFSNTSASLALIASTPEAKKGDWNGIKPYLKQLESRLPGVYFYVLPDGNYYSVALDYTNLNLRNRAYFKSLFAGHSVKGFPIYSRSSGKKSALMAVPILVNGKVVGALGASVFLDELNTVLNRDFALPPSYTWFVLNDEGNTMLDKDSEYIFMNALTQGGKSLHEAASKALKSQRGKIKYEILGSVKHGYYCKLPNMDWWMFLAKIEGHEMQAPPPLKLSLDRFVPVLQKSLNQIDDAMAKEIEKTKVDVSDEKDVRKLLDAIFKESPLVIDVSYINPKGVLLYIEPSEYKNFENADVSDQEQVIAMKKNPAPLFSGGFKAVEGFQSVDLEHPLFDDKKQFVGSISSLIRPELLVGPLLKKTTIPKDYELWIMQPDGLIIYDQDKEEIGRNLFSDPMYAGYESLLELGRKIASAPTGKGSYIFVAPGSKEKVIKNAVWKTVSLHGREWRVVLAYRPYE